MDVGELAEPGAQASRSRTLVLLDHRSPPAQSPPTAWAESTMSLLLIGERLTEAARWWLRTRPKALVCESDDTQALDAALTAVVDGGHYVSRLAGQTLLRNWPQEPGSSTIESPRFSVREREVMVAMCEGLSVPDTAVRLGIRPKTVEAHRGRAYRKLGVHHAHDALKVLRDQPQLLDEPR